MGSLRNDARSALRLVLMSTQQAWHGGEAQAALLAEGLRQRGHAVSVLARQEGAFAERMTAAGFDVATFTGRGRSLLALWQIRRELRHLRPDVLFYNDAHSLSAGSLATLRIKLPVRIAARRVDFPIRSAARYQACDRVICVSRAISAVCRAGGITAEKLRVVHDGVDPARPRSGHRDRGRLKLGLATQQSLLLTVAKLTDHKGHAFLLEAMPAVLRRHPQTVLALAGDGELTAPLQAQAERLGIVGHVRFLGFRDDVPDLLAAADVFVMPSHLEGLNTSIIDAMFAAKPIVTTTAGGIPDLVAADSATGGPVAWLVPPRDPAALAEALLDALRSPKKAAVLAELACRRAEQHFTADHMVDGMLAVIDEILARRIRLAA